MIRAYGTQETCIREFARCLDEHSRVYSVMLGMNRWSAMRIECVVAAFVGFLAFTILIMHRSKEISKEREREEMELTNCSFRNIRYSNIRFEFDISLFIYISWCCSMDCSIDS